jgi:hypothetical protein
MRTLLALAFVAGCAHSNSAAPKDFALGAFEREFADSRAKVRVVALLSTT